MDSSIASWLIPLGQSGGAIGVMVLFLNFMSKQSTAAIARDKEFLDRLDKIEGRHVEEERAARLHNAALFSDMRDIFDRVMKVCGDLSTAVFGLRDATKANELAIQELRREIQTLRESHK